MTQCTAAAALAMCHNCHLSRTKWSWPWKLKDLSQFFSLETHTSKTAGSSVLTVVGPARSNAPLTGVQILLLPQQHFDTPQVLETYSANTVATPYYATTYV